MDQKTVGQLRTLVNNGDSWLGVAKVHLKAKERLEKEGLGIWKIKAWERFLDMKDEEIQQVAKIFQNLGAEKEQAITMARQLIKRAEQLAKQNQSSKFSELQTLLGNRDLRCTR